MALRTAVADPFRRSGRKRLPASEFVVALSLDRDWFAPDEAERIVDAAVDRGLVERDGDDLVPRFDPSEATAPDGAPAVDLTEAGAPEAAPFSVVLDRLVAAGHDKRGAVADINALQNRLGVTAGTAAVVYARRSGVEVDDVAERVRDGLSAEK